LSPTPVRRRSRPPKQPVNCRKTGALIHRPAVGV
jgi:hypothetical protein